MATASRPASRGGRGDGLENMRHRLEQIGGRLLLESEPGGGTNIRMEVESG